MPFNQLQELQCLHHGATFVPLWFPILFSQPYKVTICGRHVMASVRDMKITEAPLVLCLACFVMKWVQHCWNWGVMAFKYWNMGRVSWVHSPYFPLCLDGLQRCFSCCSSLVLLCNGQNTAEYEVYWLIDAPIINVWGAPAILLKRYAQINQLKLCFQKVNNQV